MACDVVLFSLATKMCLPLAFSLLAWSIIVYALPRNEDTLFQMALELGIGKLDVWIYFDFTYLRLLFGFAAIVAMAPGSMVTRSVKLLFQVLDLVTDVIVIVFWSVSGDYVWLVVQVLILVTSAAVQYSQICSHLPQAIHHVFILAGMANCCAL